MVQHLTGAPDVQAVVHCYGATTFFWRLLARDARGVRSLVSRRSPPTCHAAATRIKTACTSRTCCRRSAFKSLTAYADKPRAG